ncbi:MAG: T9SS type A sorting domain-containing protein [Bacteroidota bacterium]
MKPKNILFIVLTAMTFGAFAQNASVTISPAGPTVCEGTTLSAVTTGMMGPFSYLWSTGDTTSSINIYQGGVYRVRVTGITHYNGVRQVSSALVPYTVIVEPHPSIFVKGDVNVCPGDSVKLVAKSRRPYYTYSWNTGATTPAIWANQSGTYVLTTSTNANGCNYSASTTVDINVFDNGYQPAITALTPLVACKPAYFNLAADPGFANYQWTWFDGSATGGSSNSQNASILLDGSGGGPILDTSTVNLTVQLGGGCKFNSSTVIRSIREIEVRSQYCGVFNYNSTDSIKAELVLTYLSAPQYQFEFEETGHPGVTWTYTSNDRWCRFADVTPALQVSKFYNVRVRPVIDGIPYCYGGICQIGIATLRPNHSTLSYAERLDGSAMDAQIYPNPSNNTFNLNLQTDLTNTPAIVTITDLSGRVVETFNFDGSENTVQFGNDLLNGIYMVTVQQGEFKNVTRVLKTN